MIVVMPTVAFAMPVIIVIPIVMIGIDQVQVIAVAASQRIDTALPIQHVVIGGTDQRIRSWGADDHFAMPLRGGNIDLKQATRPCTRTIHSHQRQPESPGIGRSGCPGQGTGRGIERQPERQGGTIFLHQAVIQRIARIGIGKCIRR